MKPDKPQNPRGILTGFLPDSEAILASRPPRTVKWVPILLALLLLSALAWAYFSKVDRLVTARGKLISTTPVMVVQPLERSIIRSLDARMGQIVQKGQLLATLDPTFAESDIARLRGELAVVKVRLKRLEAELGGKPFPAGDPKDPEHQLQAILLFKSRAQHKELLAEISENLARQRGLLRAKKVELKLLRKRTKNLAEIVRMRSLLFKERHESKLKVMEAQHQYLLAMEHLEQAIGAVEALEHEIVRLQSKKKAMALGWQLNTAEELAKTRQMRDRLREQLNKAARIGELVELKAPAAGMVIKVASVAPGSVVQAAQPVFTITPLSTPLEAEISIKARDIGFVRADSPVRLKLDAFPFQKHGTLQARVRSLSEDVVPFTNEKGVSEFVYLGLLDILDAKLRATPPDFRLIPGMALTAEIKVGERSVLSYLLYPIIKGLDEGIREP
ncbi:MAG: HlyD family type I secretion periplasmic adaptor subunit [Desulfarculaceae bacterium]|nr:HlyD family type I secretion periplasmic adaptor subunit [Desulfarculaceae bacterium]MCF8074451.1 HlyD family type I secretion periplasmic adaptor subunit [Desulfarculaceae bacterium]MCF8102709.1 HlyD family type I secretion periplasmic adaptor subunit [Desulfarculaceae bacterium]MCF8116436.1 HlyD family type I secretion periplasmic adaptor subunit [Desulfarculaceae bacterium]